MTSTSPEGAVLRGGAGATVRTARIDQPLRTTAGLASLRADARLVDPVLEASVAQAAEEARGRAHREGFSAGYEDGRAAADAELAVQMRELKEHSLIAAREHAARVERLVEAMSAALHDLEHRCLPAYEQIAAELVDVAMDLAEAVVGHDLRGDRTLLREVVAAIVTSLPHDAPVRIDLAPALVPVLEDLTIDLTARAGRPVRLAPDPMLRDDECRVVSDAVQVRWSVEQAFERMRTAMAARP